MVMGPTHAMSGAAAWLTAAAFGGGALATIASGGPAVVTIGSIVCAGAALAPDFDSHSATAVRSFGIFGKIAHNIVNAISVSVYTLTATKYDSPKTNGHRTLFHTTLMAIIVGVLVSLGSSLPGTTVLFDKTFANGQLFSLAVLAFFLHLGLAGVFEKQVKKARKKYGPYLLMLGSLAGTATIAYFLPENEKYSWLGAAVAMGWFMHLLGDMITKMGVPLAFPFKIRGKRWYDVSLPPFLRISADGIMNNVLLVLCTVISLVMLVWIFTTDLFTATM